MKTFADIKKGDKVFCLSWDKNTVFSILVTAIREYKNVVRFYTRDHYGNTGFSVPKEDLNIAYFPSDYPNVFSDVVECINQITKNYV